MSARRRSDPISEWAAALRQRAGWQKATVLLAKTNARILWAVMTRGEAFDARHVSVKPPGSTSPALAKWRRPAGRLVFSFVDQAVQSAVRGQGVALVRSPFLQDCLASGDLVMPFPELRMPAGYRHVLILSPEVARRPHVAEFVAWLNEQFAQAPRL